MTINDTRAADAKRLLGDIVANMAGYSDSELLRLKNTADTFSWMVRTELRARDTRMVDEACALKIGEAA
jgi:hypothetical protein